MAQRDLKKQNERIKNSYDRLNLTFPKGKKEIYRKQAELKGMSLNSYINYLLELHQNGFESDSTQAGNQSDTQTAKPDIPIENLGLSVRSFSILKRFKIDSLNQWIALSDEEKKTFAPYTVREMDETCKNYYNQDES